jgi:guanine deaminase
MSLTRETRKRYIRRITLGVIVASCLIVGTLWFLPSSQSSVAMAVIPVPQDIASPTGEFPQNTGHAVRDKRVLSSEEIKSRFPVAMHEEFMRRAIANSHKAGVQYKTGGAFGAVIVNRDGEVLADGVNHVIAQNDPTWHAEMHAIRQACALMKSPKLEGCILYTSSEPCPMCLATAYWAGLDGIVYGATVADSTKYGDFDDGYIYEQFSKPIEDRAISEQEMLRPEAVEVWKEYKAREDKVPY